VNNNDSFRAIWFIMLFLLAIAIFSNLSNLLLLALLGAAAFWIFRNVDLSNIRNNLDMFNNGNLFRNSRDGLLEEYEDEDPFLDDDEPDERTVQREPVYRHALTAVENAGLNPDSVQVLAVDLGVLVHRKNAAPTVYRTWTVPEDVVAIQPFVNLRLPTEANGRVKFEVVDASGKVMFANEADYKLQKGRNFISPAARMPLRDLEQMDGQWSLRISADNVLLAVHRFEFAEATTARIRQHLAEDGELSTDTRLVMDENPLPKMSLDDLLAFQDEEEKARRK
jgi:hypothetical protein